ncbi:MAG: hypothetical protein K2X36_10270, partial [Microbacteriaceae bacterium]|nr:hypothetical protein [Microbacteriaceae bacterium]
MVTSVAICPTSRGSASTASTRCARRPVSKVSSASIARVLLDSPLPQLDRLFDYRIPERWREQAVPGVRVLVPLRSAGRQAKGFIVEVADEVGYEGVLSELDEV